MSGNLTHPQSDIVRHLIINLGYASLPSGGNDWPTYIAKEPDTPDNCITIYDTEGRQGPRDMPTGRRQENHGFQIRVRSSDQLTGYAKARTLAVALDESVRLNNVIIDSSTYIVYVVSRSGDVNYLGRDSSQGYRNLFTINAVVALRQVT